MAEGKEVLVCRRCEVAVETILEEEHPGRIRCPKCGRGAELDVALRVAGQFLLYHPSGPLKGLQDRLVRNTRGSKHVKHTLRRLPRIDPPDFILV